MKISPCSVKLGSCREEGMKEVCSRLGEEKQEWEWGEAVFWVGGGCRGRGRVVAGI